MTNYDEGYDPDTINNEGLNTCSACGGHGSVDQYMYSYCCCAPTTPRDFTKD